MLGIKRSPTQLPARTARCAGKRNGFREGGQPKRTFVRPLPLLAFRQCLRLKRLLQLPSGIDARRFERIHEQLGDSSGQGIALPARSPPMIRLSGLIAPD